MKYIDNFLCWIGRHNWTAYSSYRYCNNRECKKRQFAFRKPLGGYLWADIPKTEENDA